VSISIWHIKKKDPAEWGDWWLVVEKDVFEDRKTLKRWERLSGFLQPAS